MQDLLKTVPAVLEWCQKHKPLAPVPTAPAATPAASKGSVVFTGVRDKELEAKATAAGWTMSDTLTKKTSLLIVADDAKDSVKTKKATEYGIRIMKITEFRALC
jgi:NAD-dependent DNA ligase